MLNLPPPKTFADGQRLMFGLLMTAAGVCFGLAALAGASVIIWGDWPESLAKTRLLILGGALGGAIAGSILVTVALAVGGPVGRAKTRITKEGVEVEADAK